MTMPQPNPTSPYWMHQFPLSAAAPGPAGLMAPPMAAPPGFALPQTFGPPIAFQQLLQQQQQQSAASAQSAQTGAKQNFFG